MRRAIGGTSVNENLEATPLAEDGFLYVVDKGAWSTRSTAAPATWPHRLAHGSRSQEKMPAANRGAALWGNLVISIANYPPRLVATNNDRPDRVGGEPRRRTARPGSSPPRRLRSRIRSSSARRVATRACGLHHGARRRDRKDSMEELRHPGSGRAGQRNLEGQEQRLADRRRCSLGDRVL